DPINEGEYGSFNEVTNIITGEADQQLGFSVAIGVHGDAFAGAPLSDENGTDSGKVYFFSNSNDQYNSYIRLSTPALGADSHFGWSIATGFDYNEHSPYIVVGAPGFQGKGAAFLYKKIGEQYLYSATLTASDGLSGDRFGTSVSAYGDYIIVGAPENDSSETDAGSTYLFKNNGNGIFTEIEKISAADASRGNAFGRSVSLSQTHAIVGSDDVPNSSQGSAYIYDIVRPITLSIDNNSTHEDTNLSINLQNFTNNPEAETITYTADSNDTSIATVSINGSVLTISPVLNAYGDITIEVNATASTQSVSTTFLVRVTAVNDAPSNITLSANAVVGNSPVGTTVGIVSADEADGDGVTFGLDCATAGADDGKFHLLNTLLETKEILNDQTRSHYTICVKARDFLGASTEKTFHIFVGDDFREVNTFTPDNLILGNNTGQTVAISDLYAVIADAKGVYLFKNDGNGNFIQGVKLAFSGGETTAYSAVIKENYIVLGTGESAAYVFKKDGNGYFNEVAKLISPIDDYFGVSVAMDGDYVVVGAWNKDNNSGSAYIFENDGNDNFSNVATLTGSDSVDNDGFGISVAINGQYIVVGTDSAPQIIKGGAYVYKNNGNNNFTEIAKLTSSYTRDVYDNFGISIAMNDKYIFVGSSSDDGNVNHSGTVYVFENDGSDNFISIAKLSASDAGSSDLFGESIAVNGNYLIIGARGDDDNGGQSGATYIFKYNTNGNFSEVTKLDASDAVAGAWYGYRVSISDNYAIIGALWHPNGGKAYIYNYTATGVYHDKSVNNTPTNIILDSNKIDENSAIGSVVGTVNAIDADSGDYHVFQLNCATSGQDDTEFLMAGNELVTQSTLNFEMKSSYEICIQVTDTGSASYEKMFTITVNDIDEDNDNDGKLDSVDPDDDNDGMPDAYELLYPAWLDKWHADGDHDADYDCFTNLEEYRAGTSP
ncbi:MAG: hypothetical protein DRP93_07720, partial [Candidatus Neomarinimicrobiota bacterium]